MVVGHPDNADVVFIVEGTANLGAYFKELKTSYIQPTLEHYNNGPLIETDFSGDYGGTLYSLVIFSSADCFPEPAVNCFRPTSNAWELSNMLDRIPFLGGGGESYSLIAEGMGAAMQIFDDQNSRRNPGVTRDRQCVLICNSPPFGLPCMEGTTYSGYTADDLAGLMAQNNISLSVISPRKLPILQQLYDKACGELQMLPIKDYTTDPRHLVLLKGYELKSDKTVNQDSKDPVAKQMHSPIKQPSQVLPNTSSPASSGLGGSSTTTTQATGSINKSVPSPIGIQPRGSPAPDFKIPAPSQNTSQAATSIGNQPSPGQPQQTQPSSYPQPQPQQPQSQQQQQNQQQQQKPTPTVLQQQQPAQTSQPGQQPQPAGQPGQKTGLMSQAQFTQLTQLRNQLTPEMIQKLAPEQRKKLQMKLAEQTKQLQLRQQQMLQHQQQQQQPQTQPQMQFQPQPQQQQPQLQPQQPPQQPQAGNMQQFPTPNISTAPGTGQIQPNITITSQQPVSLQSKLNTVNAPSAALKAAHDAMMAANRQRWPPPQQQQQTVGNNPMVSQQTPIPRPNVPTQPQAPRHVDPTAAAIAATQLAAQQQQQQQQHDQQQQLQMISQQQSMTQQQPDNTAGLDTQQRQGLGIPAPQQQQRQHKSIWHGTLEWHEKPKSMGPNSNKITRTLTCHVMASPDSPLKADNWPPKLIMQLLPQTLLQSLKMMIQNSQNVGFVFPQQNNNPESMKALMRVMQQNFAGCVHFPSETTSNIRVMLLLYSGNKKQFIGLIPNDQAGFVNQFRMEVTKHKKNQLERSQQLIQQQVQQGGFPGGSGLQQPGGSISTMPNTMGNIGMPPATVATVTTGGITSAGAITGNTVPRPQATPGTGTTNVLERERQENLLKIQELHKNLEAAKQREIQLKNQQMTNQQLNYHQRIPQPQMQQVQQRHPSLQLQQQQQQQQQVNPQQQSQQQPTQVPQLRPQIQGQITGAVGHSQSQQLPTNNPQLRHLLMNQPTTQPQQPTIPSQMQPSQQQTQQMQWQQTPQQPQQPQQGQATQFRQQTAQPTQLMMPQGQMVRQQVPGTQPGMQAMTGQQQGGIGEDVSLYDLLK